MLMNGIAIGIRALLVVSGVCFIIFAGYSAWKSDMVDGVEDAAMFASFCNSAYRVANLARVENREISNAVAQEEATCAQKGVPRPSP